MEDDLENYASYTCDFDIRVEDEQGKTGQVFYDHLISICSIWNGGKRGLRFQPGLISAYKNKGMKVPKPKRKSLRSKNRTVHNRHPKTEVYQLSDVLKEELVEPIPLVTSKEEE